LIFTKIIFKNCCQ